MMAGDLLGALQSAEDWTRDEPSNPQAWALKSEALELLGRTEAARKAAARSALLDPTRADMVEFAAGATPEELPAPPAAPIANPAQTGPSPAQQGFFPALGWVIAVASLCCTLAFIVILGRAMPEIMKDPVKYQTDQQAAMEVFGPNLPALFAVSSGVWLATLLWLLVDILNKRARIGWLVAGVLVSFLFCLFPYCGPGWLFLPIYFLLGRKKA